MLGVMSFRPEEIDLAELASTIRRELVGFSPIVGYAEGKTVLRDRVVTLLDCSELEAEELVDTLVARGFLRFSGDPSLPIDDGTWQIEVDVGPGGAV